MFHSVTFKTTETRLPTSETEVKNLKIHNAAMYPVCQHGTSPTTQNRYIN